VRQSTQSDHIDSRGDGRAWYTVAFLALLYVFSMVDRTIFALLAAPISKDLQLSDAQMSVILGMSFAIVYAVAGLPVAHWLDTRPRRTIVALGVLLWSGMTIGAAFATSFWSLLFFRSGLAFGEAVLSPAAVSLIGDMFVRDRRALPTSFYASIGAAFSTGAYAVGALVLSLATPVAHLIGLAPWQMTVGLLGLTTMVLGLLFLITVTEPVRGTPASDGPAASLGSFLRYLQQNAVFYLPFYFGFGLNSCFGFGFYSWAPAVFQREQFVNSSTSGFIFGAVGMAGGLFGALVVPQISARIERKRPAGSIPAVLIAIAVTEMPAAILLPLANSAVLLYLCGFLTVLCSTGGHVLGSLCIQQYADSHMRARLMAIYLFATSLIGLSVGPPLVVLFSTFWPANGQPLAHGIAVLAACTIPSSVFCFVKLYQGSRKLDVSAT
jgi:MFS family permease